MTINIAICDDENSICSQIEEYILDLKKASYCVEIFLTGEALFSAMKSGSHFDLIFLDIEMENLNGIELGRLIRKELGDELVHIVYISSKMSYAMELFNNRPLNFLIKPISKDSLADCICYAENLLSKEEAFFEFEFARKINKIALKNILYFESQGRKIYVYTPDRIFEFTGKTGDIISKLRDFDFIQIHKSIIINYLFLQEYSYDHIILTNGTVLSISKERRKEVRSKIFAKRAMH